MSGVNVIGLSLLDSLATGINKDDPIVNTVLADRNGKGAVADEMEDVFDFIRGITQTTNIAGWKGEALDTLVSLFANLRRRIGEGDDMLLLRLMALTYRQGDTIWGNRLNLKHAAEIYFPAVACYVAENTAEENLMLDGDFEDDVCKWTVNSDALKPEARFCNTRGLSLLENESCSQDIRHNFTEGVYVLHCMATGRCGVVIQRENQYWNADAYQWEENEYINELHKEGNDSEWEDRYLFVNMYEATDLLSVEFLGRSGYIDYVRLYRKPPNPSYTLILQYKGQTKSKKILHMGETETEDSDLNDSYFVTQSNTEANSEHASYITGLSGLSKKEAVQSFIDRIRPLGVQVFIEFIETMED